MADESLNGTATVDGRIARGERTRERLAEALVSLLEEGDPEPTARAVAERAGVSLRLVFHHFSNMDAIYQEVVAMQVDRYWSALRPVPACGPLAKRIADTVQTRARLFEAIGPVRRGAATMAAGSVAVAEEISSSNVYMRSLLITTFGPELDAAGPGRKELLDIIDAAASFENWDRLRAVQGLGPISARRAMARMISSCLGGRCSPSS